ncbi:copper resistance CopC/CopD family protein [Streptomyces sp. NPDC052773]|uniref:copper resistance CopC/CopD family protein n=1 Tax=Streptomyces sp. NPDC052773 TaxID=3365693 RepID=UPI0037D15B00
MTQTIAPRVRSLVLLLLAVAAALLAAGAPASAHAALTGSDPRQGAVVDQAPEQISLTFSETVSLSDDALRVLGPKGERADTGEARGVGATYSVKLRPGLPDGTYTVSYQVVSADSHPVAGAFTFSIGAPSATTVTVSEQTAGGGLVGSLYGLGRYASYAGFIVLAGGAAFALACWPRGTGVRAVQRLVVSGWVTLTAATLGLLLLRGSYTTSGKFGDVFDLELLGQVLQTKTGAALVSRLLLLAAAALFIAVLFGAYAKRVEGDLQGEGDGDGEGARDGEGAGEGEKESRDLAFGLAVGGVVVAAGLAASWAMAEHASTGLQPGIAMPVDVVHLLAVAAWLGGLVTLLVALYRAPAGTPLDAAAVRRFSRVAFGSVLALVATGLYQSWRQVGSWSALTGTRYGQLLCVKVALVVLLVGVAWISRRWTGRLTDTTADTTAVTDPGVAVNEERVAARTGGGGTDTAEADPERAAQLARQRAAVDAAREKRLRDADPNRSGLRRSVLAEAGVAVVLLAVTTMLTSTEPGRTEEEAKAATAASSSASASGTVTLDMPFDTGGEDGKGVVRIDLDPARTGANDMHVYVTRPNGRVFDVPEVKVAFTLESQDIGPLPVVPDHITTGHWSASGVQIPMAGEWKIAVTVRTSDIDQVTVDKNAQIG